MKLFHTADWHLGKRIHGVHMTEDQRVVLRRFVEAVEREQPDAVIIAGDLYDRAVPPVEAVELLNEILQTIVLDLETPVLAISGNHDSPDRLDFGSGMMRARGLHLAGTFQASREPVVLADADGEVHVHLVPYADPAFVRNQLDEANIRTHDEAMQAIVERISRTMDGGARHLLVGHAFVTPGGQAQDNTSDAERPLSIGGVEYVAAEHFQPFDYVALGHLHQAHHVGYEWIRYAGSPLKYSVNEAAHNKGFTIVELDGDGRSHFRHVPLAPLRDLRKEEGMLADILRHEPSEDYVFITLLDENPVLHPMEKVRAVYPNALHIERRLDSIIHKDLIRSQASAAAANGTRERIDPVQLFASFYREVTDSPLSEAKQQHFTRIYEETLRAEGERT